MQDVVIIGSGFSGLGAAIKLQKNGYTYSILEKSNELGGVWRENIYPGCACDIPAIFYSYSFSPNSDWSRFFAKQDEIKEYAYKTAKKFNLIKKIKFNHELLKANWDEEKKCWELITNQGTYFSKFVIFGTGPMHEVVTPNILGRDTFKGECFHSAEWDGSIDLTNKKVAVIGTGASAIQFVPEIYSTVKELAVFQRTAPWVIPKVDFKIKTVWQKLFKYFPIIQKVIRLLLSYYFNKLNNNLNDLKSRQKLQAIAIKNIKRGVKDINLQQKLIPNYDIGCKRILQSNKWYRTLSQKNVTVCDGVDKIENNKIIAKDGTEFLADVVIYATGFKVANPPVAKLIYGTTGKSLNDEWNGSPKAYLGTMLPTCPNAFLMLGPNLYAFTSAFTMIELQLKYIIKAINYMKTTKNIKSIVVKNDVTSDYNNNIQDVLATTVWRSNGCSSYFIDKNGNNSTNWPHSIKYMRNELSNFRIEDYKI